MESRKVIGAKTQYGVTKVFVFRKPDGSYAPCLLEDGLKKGFPEKTYPDLEQAKEAAAHESELALRGAPLTVGEVRRIEDLRNWTDLYEGELPEACRHPRHARED